MPGYASRRLPSSLPEGQYRSFIQDMNRIKVVLVEKKKTSKWLAEVLGKNPATISKWCTNTSQPDVATLREIARVLDIDVKELLNSTK